MAEQMLPQSACRAIWALLEKGNAITIDHACEASQQAPWVVFRYFQLLEKHGYLSLAGYQLATGDEILTTFTLIKRTGRDAPHIDEDGRFVDPNQPRRYARADRIGMTARVRIAAELFDRPFSLEELRNAVTNDEREFSKLNRVYWRMKYAGELVEVAKGWKYRTDARIKSIRELIKHKFIGETFTITDLEAIFCIRIRPAMLRRVLSELKVEGFKMKLLRPRRDGRKLRAYLVKES